MTDVELVKLLRSHLLELKQVHGTHIENLGIEYANGDEISLRHIKRFVWSINNYYGEETVQPESAVIAKMAAMRDQDEKFFISDCYAIIMDTGFDQYEHK